MELQHRQSQTCGFAHPGSRILQVTFPEHGAGDEDGSGTGLIIRDITDTLDNAGDSLLAVAHTSGRARYTCRTGGICAWAVTWVVTVVLVIHTSSGKRPLNCFSTCAWQACWPAGSRERWSWSAKPFKSSCLFRSTWRPVRLLGTLLTC